jgi:hypothetical protein
MPPSDQVSLGLKWVVNASYRGPEPPTLSEYVPKFLPFFRISGYERLGADEGVGRTSIGIYGLSRPAGGDEKTVWRRPARDGASSSAKPDNFSLASIDGGSTPISGIESMIVTRFPAAVSARMVLVNPSSNSRRSHDCEQTSPSPDSVRGPAGLRTVAAPFSVKRPARDQHDVAKLRVHQEVEDAPVEGRAVRLVPLRSPRRSAADSRPTRNASPPRRHPVLTERTEIL